jgi:hypothetical protein
MDTKNILGIVPGLQATALVGQNLKMFDMKPGKKHSSKKFVKMGVTNLVGVGLITASSKMINDL